jgi:uncharacterized repeat protein (TIGR03803 family)
MTKLNGWKLTVLFFMMCAAMTGVSLAQTLTTVHSFDLSDGGYPGPLVQGTDGRLYGTTQFGGANGSNCKDSSLACGTAFAITPAGALTTLYSFCAQATCDDGGFPSSGLTLLQDGNFYGTTYGGGSVKADCNNDGCGTAFEMNPAGILSTIYNFCSLTGCADGVGPEAGLLQAPDGNFYGTVAYGGVPTSGGTVVKMTPTGTLTTLYRFCSKPKCSDGETPVAPVILAADGNFYGTTFGGGLRNSNQYPCSSAGCGTIFKLTPSGTLTTIYSFCSQPNCSDGTNPNGGLVQALDGRLWGTTGYGGKHGYGTVFAITGEGKLTTLHSFHVADGETPYANLIQATDGNFYGITAYGGKYYVRDKIQGGTLFKITPQGVLTTLYNFCAEANCADGLIPVANLMQFTNGIIYGTTANGGGSSNCSSGCGTVFSLNLNLAPFVALIHSTGPVGQTGGILGQGFTGTTAVAINGTPANFTVVSDTFITATVPAGATTGYVTVTTPNGVLKSNVPFRVIR